MQLTLKPLALWLSLNSTVLFPACLALMNVGGPLVESAPLSEAELQTKIVELLEKIEFSTERLSSLEAKL